MNKALEGADIVLVPAGVPRKPGMTRDDLFNINAGIVANVAKSVAQTCPKAQLLIISNPVNSTVPVAAEVLKRMNAFDPKRVFGVTTLDEFRALTFLRKALESKGKELKQSVTVIGGHAGITILPLISQLQDAGLLTEAEIAALTQRIMFGGDEVVKAKDGGGSATLSMAAAAHSFADAVMAGLSGEKVLPRAAYVFSDVCTDKEVEYFASLVTLGKEGVGKILAPGTMSAFEQQKYKELLPELKDSIKKGAAFGKAYKL
jgi:malate dehydrogenase